MERRLERCQEGVVPLVRSVTLEELKRGRHSVFLYIYVYIHTVRHVVPH